MQLEPYHLGNDIYWVGAMDNEGELQCNPYLIIDEDESTLIDPGSVLDFDIVKSQIEKLIPLTQIKHVILTHQDPDLCAAVPLFEAEGLEFQIVTHWRAAILQKYYGIKSPFYLVNEHGFELQLKSGRKIDFLHTPYLHFPGAIMAYDQQSKVLFSSDLFGSFSKNNKLFADKNYIEGMKVFHENYMPSNDILQPIMELIRNIPISIIAPQHGSIINKDITKYINILSSLECGAFITPIRKHIADIGGYTGVSNLIIKRLIAVFTPSDVKKLFQETPIKVNIEDGIIEDFSSSGPELWNNLFEIIYSKKGYSWISVLETIVTRICKEYGIEQPEVYQKEVLGLQKKTEQLTKENVKLLDQNKKLGQDITNTKDSMTQDLATHLYNEPFFYNFIKDQSKHYSLTDESFHIIIFELLEYQHMLDNIGTNELDEVLKGIAFILTSNKQLNSEIFRLSGPYFAIFSNNPDKQQIIDLAYSLRNKISTSNIFQTNVSVTGGLASIEETKSDKNHVNSLIRMAKARSSLAKRDNTLQVCVDSCTPGSLHQIDILLVDADTHNTKILSNIFTQLGYSTKSCVDGQSAIEQIEQLKPKIIISEVILPKVDGFSIKKYLSEQAELSGTPFIFVSFKKDERSVKRALSLEVDYYFQKPYMLSEVVGIVKNKLNKMIND